MITGVEKNHVTALLLKPKELFSFLFNLWASARPQGGDNELVTFIVHLNKTNNIDFCDLGTKAIDSGIFCF